MPRTLMGDMNNKAFLKARQHMDSQMAARDAMVVTMRKQGMTLQAIATQIGVSRERVRQICKIAGVKRK